MICTEITISETDCNSIPVDTWKPASITVESGKSLSFTVHSASPNKLFRLYYEAGIPAITKVLIEATTDSQGCYTGTIQPLPDGEYTIYLCYPLIGICAYGHSQIIVRWGSKPLGITEMILYGALGLGAAYIIGQVIAKDGKK